jgi:NADH-quinone oxidoreductase subunit E
MLESIAEVILWILLIFFIGCILGYLVRGVFGGGFGTKSKINPPRGSNTRAERAGEARSETEKTVELASKVVTVEPPGPEPAAEPLRDDAPRPPKRKATAEAVGEQLRASKLTEQGNGSQPRGLPAPRGGSPDSLQRISGVGPKIENMLHDLGIFHFDQIAGWTEEQERWVDGHLRFKGRIGRDGWVKQAKLLADGKEEEFASLYRKAEAVSGNGTRRKGNRTAHH